MTIRPSFLTSLVSCWAAVVPWLLAPPITSLVDPVKSFVHLVQSPFGYLHVTFGNIMVYILVFEYYDTYYEYLS